MAFTGLRSGSEDPSVDGDTRPRFSKWLIVALIAAAILTGIAPASADQDGAAADAVTPPQLPLPPPPWYTKEVHRQVLAAGGKGIEVPLARNDPQAELVLDCMGTSPPSAIPPSPLAVSAGGCMVYPSGCTMNYIFTDGNARYIGTAGHCVGGGDVVMQVGTRVDPTDTVIVTVAKVGRVARRIDSGIGADFGLVRIDAGWPVVPGVAGAIGPVGAFCGDPLGQPVLHYGHGYVFAVEQGHPKVGEVILDATLLFKFRSAGAGYNWVGYGLPGDSGSPVMDIAGLAVGNLTHGVSVLGVPIPGLSFGMTLGGILAYLGSSYSLVTVDGRAVKCDGLVGV